MKVSEPNCQLAYLTGRVAAAGGTVTVLHDSARAIAAITSEQSAATTTLIDALGGARREKMKNDSIRIVFDELASSLTSVNRAREESRLTLDRVALLTSQFEQYASALLPAHHVFAAASKGRDSSRALESWGTASLQVQMSRQLARDSEAAAEEKIEAAASLTRQLELRRDGKADALLKQSVAAQSAADRAANICRKLKDKLQREIAHEAQAAQEVGLQAQQFEHDRVELLQLVLGTLVLAQPCTAASHITPGWSPAQLHMVAFAAMHHVRTDDLRAQVISSTDK